MWLAKEEKKKKKKKTSPGKQNPMTKLFIEEEKYE